MIISDYKIFESYQIFEGTDWMRRLKEVVDELGDYDAAVDQIAQEFIDSPDTPDMSIDTIKKTLRFSSVKDKILNLGPAEKPVDVEDSVDVMAELFDSIKDIAVLDVAEGKAALEAKLKEFAKRKEFRDLLAINHWSSHSTADL